MLLFCKPTHLYTTYYIMIERLLLPTMPNTPVNNLLVRLNQTHFDRIINTWNSFNQYIQSKHDMGDAFLYYDIHLIRNNSKQLVQFLRDRQEVMMQSVLNYQGNQGNQVFNVSSNKHSDFNVSMSTALVMDVEKIITTMRTNWNPKMNSVRVEIESAIRAYETTEIIFLCLLADIYRYLYEFNNNLTTYTKSKQLYEKALAYINDALSREPYFKVLSNSDEDMYGVFLNYSILCYESNHLREALVLCDEALHLFDQFSVKTQKYPSVLVLMKSNKKTWMNQYMSNKSVSPTVSQTVPQTVPQTVSPTVPNTI